MSKHAASPSGDTWITTSCEGPPWLHCGCLLTQAGEIRWPLLTVGDIWLVDEPFPEALLTFLHFFHHFLFSPSHLCGWQPGCIFSSFYWSRSPQWHTNVMCLNGPGGASSRQVESVRTDLFQKNNSTWLLLKYGIKSVPLVFNVQKQDKSWLANLTLSRLLKKQPVLLGLLSINDGELQHRRRVLMLNFLLKTKYSPSSVMRW